MITAEELNTLKKEVKILNRKLDVLTDEEPAQISGGETGRSIRELEEVAMKVFLIFYWFRFILIIRLTSL